MPWYNRDSLRKAIITGEIDYKNINLYMKPILDFLWSKLYICIDKNPSTTWVNKNHFDRYHNRIRKIRNLYPFNKIFNKKKIIINNIEYENLPLIINKIQNFNKNKKLFNPRKLYRIHGDLHFQNILIGRTHEDFILADPRGDINSDIFYDMGKLWHSFNGKYDLIHTNISKSKIINNDFSNFELDFGPKYLISHYNFIFEKIVILINNNYPIAKDSNWKLKTEFSEFMHFSSLLNFHLEHDKIENKALCLYLVAVILGNKLINQLK